ncbi:MAG: hypothetical protein ACI35O_10340 [Bacillaceae bacterium]
MKKVAGVVLMAFAVALIVLPATGNSNGSIITKVVKDPGGGGR